MQAGLATPFRRWALFWRKRMPQSVRLLFRFGRHLVSRVELSPQLPQALLDDCRVCASRFDLVERLPRGGRVAEVGTERGGFARHILAVSEPAELHLIDLDFSQLDPAVRQEPRVVLHHGASHEVLCGLPDSFFDWIYVDADHSYAGTSRDAHAAAPKVKPGGFLVFNDFAYVDPYLGQYGVHRAVTEFATAHQWRFAWFAYSNQALYDVALQRPLDGANPPAREH